MGDKRGFLLAGSSKLSSSLCDEGVDRFREMGEMGAMIARRWVSRTEVHVAKANHLQEAKYLIIEVKVEVEAGERSSGAK
jgi:hypothetical protein